MQEIFFEKTNELIDIFGESSFTIEEIKKIQETIGKIKDKNPSLSRRLILTLHGSGEENEVEDSMITIYMSQITKLNDSWFIISCNDKFTRKFYKIDGFQELIDYIKNNYLTL